MPIFQSEEFAHFSERRNCPFFRATILPIFQGTKTHEWGHINKGFDLPSERGLSQESSRAGGKALEDELHVGVRADAHCPADSCPTLPALRQVEQEVQQLDVVILRLFLTGNRTVEDVVGEGLIRSEPAGQVLPLRSRHVPPDEDVTPPDVPLDLKIGHRLVGIDVLGGEVHLDDGVASQRHAEMIHHPSVCTGLRQQLHAQVPRVPWGREVEVLGLNNDPFRREFHGCRG